MTDRLPRAVLAAGIAAGLVHAATFPLRNPAQVAVATDVYHHAAAAALAGGDLYAVAPPAHPDFRFLYPPVVGAVMLPYGVVGPTGAYAVQTALSLASLAVLGGVLVRTAERFTTLGRTDRALVVGYAVAAPPAVTNLVMGQVNPQLAVGLAAVVLLAERNREGAAAGALAVVATVKPFLAPVGAWLLRRRPSRALGGAAAVGVGLGLAGLAALGPAATTTYLTGTLPRAAATGTFAGPADPRAPYLTVRRALAAVAPGLPAAARLPVAVAVVAPVVVAANRRATNRRTRLAAYQVTVLGVLVLFPLEPFYLQLAAFPLVALCYALEGWPRRLVCAGTLVLSVPATLPVVETWLSALPAWLAEGVLAVAEPVFAVALPAMAGIWLVVAGCLLAQRQPTTPA